MDSSSIDTTLRQANSAFQSYKTINGKQRAEFLIAIADGIQSHAAQIGELAQQETNLPQARIQGEINRTIGQIKQFAALLDAGHWVQASIDTASPERVPAPKPDIRKMMQPIGPIVVFGASNFPIAFSTAGGDTISALAAGCSVVVKGHPAHPRTSAFVAGIIDGAVEKSDAPKFVFQHIEDPSIEVGQQLVKHPLTKGVAFTGSYNGGKALFDLANQRAIPIPVFAEMGSINPILVLPEGMTTKNAEMIAGSVLQGVGQFCTNPGLIFLPESDVSTAFIGELTNFFSKASPEKMLHQGISRQYRAKKNSSLTQTSVTTLVAVADSPDELLGSATIASVPASEFIKNDHLREEIFGPFTLVVNCKNTGELRNAIASLNGQLTCSIFGTNELKEYAVEIDMLRERSGRIIFNGVPTGVEVCRSMHHGGPFPAATDSRFTSVGVDAIYRFVRPVSYQNCPDHLLPDELKNSNPLQLLRCVDNNFTTAALS